MGFIPGLGSALFCSLVLATGMPFEPTLHPRLYFLIQLTLTCTANKSPAIPLANSGRNFLPFRDGFAEHACAGEPVNRQSMPRASGYPADAASPTSSGVALITGPAGDVLRVEWSRPARWSGPHWDGIFAESLMPILAPPFPHMGRLFLHMGVFALVTLVIAALCFWFVHLEERKKTRR